MEEKKKSSFGKSIIVAAIVLIILVAILVGFGVLGLPSWPFLILLVVCAEVYALGTENYWRTALTGLIGLSMGFLPTILAKVGISATVTGVVFLAALVVFVALDVEKNKFVANVLCMVNMNIVINVPGVATVENLAPVFLSYGLGVAVVAAIIYGLRALAMSAAKKRVVKER